MQLFAYQKEGVAFLERRKGRALLADSMGLGKTAQALGWLNHRKSARPVIVICPTSVRLHWQQEIKTWLGEAAYLPVSRRGDGNGYDDQPFVIIHYGIVAHWVEWLRRLRPTVLIIDEAHFIKSNEAKRTKAIKKLARKVPHVIGLTGTPIVNRPIEAFNLLQIIDRKMFPRVVDYRNRYCDPTWTPFGWTYNGATNTKELHDILTKSLVLRRRKEDVLKDLPPKLRSFVPLELDNPDSYDFAEEDFLGFLKEHEDKAAAARAKRALTLTKISKLRLLAAKGRLGQSMDWIADTIETQKLVTFAVHREIIDPVFERFKKVAVRIDGDVSEAERGKAIQRFQNDPSCTLFIGQIQAAGTGITLTAASHVAFLELPWTPGELLQCEDRCHRIGQVDSVSIYYLLAIGTIDEQMAKLIDRKRSVLDSVLDGSADASPAIIAELMRTYKKRRRQCSTTGTKLSGGTLQSSRAGLASN